MNYSNSNSSSPYNPREQIVRDFVTCLERHQIQLVCFDFDETITVNGKRFVSKTFSYLAQQLHERGIRMAITTFNMGFDIESLLRRKNIPVDEAPIPVIRRVSQLDFAFGKYWHITQAMKFFDIPILKTPLASMHPHPRIKSPPHCRVLLIDDLQNNVIWARKFGVCALEVQKRKGLSVDDLLRCLANVKFYFHPRGPYRFIPSIGQPSHIPPSVPHNFHFAPTPKDLLFHPEITNLLAEQDPFGHPFLLAVQFHPQSLLSMSTPFMVVETRIPTFLNSLAKTAAESSSTKMRLVGEFPLLAS